MDDADQTSPASTAAHTTDEHSADNGLRASLDPDHLDVDLERVEPNTYPEDLVEHGSRWLLWQESDGRKVPRNPRWGRTDRDDGYAFVSAKNPEAWFEFDTAHDWADHEDDLGLAYYLTDPDRTDWDGDASFESLDPSPPEIRVIPFVPDGMTADLPHHPHLSEPLQIVTRRLRITRSPLRDVETFVGSRSWTTTSIIRSRIGPLCIAFAGSSQFPKFGGSSPSVDISPDVSAKSMARFRVATTRCTVIYVRQVD